MLELTHVGSLDNCALFISVVEIVVDLIKGYSPRGLL